MIEWMRRQIKWSSETFGLGRRNKGIVEHIRKELREVEQKPYDLEEWIDVAILALDGAWRCVRNNLVFKPGDEHSSISWVMEMLETKQRKNMRRLYLVLDKNADVAVEHDRSKDEATKAMCSDPIDWQKLCKKYDQIAEHEAKVGNAFRASKDESAPALDRQVGGSHYKEFVIQPVEFCQKNKLNYCESAVVKYVCRHQHKNGRQDIEKAIHYLQLLLELEYPRNEAEVIEKVLDREGNVVAVAIKKKYTGEVIKYGEQKLLERKLTGIG